MKTVAHCVNAYLHGNGQWIHSQMVGLRRYRPIVLAQKRQNVADYPVAQLYCADQSGIVQRILVRGLRKLTGQYPAYGPILAREQAGLLHAHFGYEGFRYLRSQAASGLPLLTSFYGADATKSPREAAWRRRYEELFDRGTAFLAEGSAMGNQLIEIGCPPEKVRICHLGVEVDRIPFTPREPVETVRFLIAAGFKEKKGIPFALSALGKLRREAFKTFELTLVGDGPDRALILEAISQNGLVDQTKVCGLLSYSDLMRELERCHILLQPSVVAADGDSEGGAPVILLDAQASGMPVIATRHADIPEYVVDGQGGLLVPERDVESLFECIRALVEDQSRWQEMGRAGRRHVEQQYNATRQREQLEAIYDEFVSEAA